MTTFDDFIAKWTGQPVDFDLHTSNELLVVDFGVIGTRNDYQVFESIISLVKINMMDYLVRGKVAAKRFFHNKSVLSNTVVISRRMVRPVYQDVITLLRNTTIPVPMSLPLIENARTFRRAIFAFPNSIRSEFLTTGNTALKALTSLVITRTTAMTWFIGGWALERFLALNANKQHNTTIYYAMNGVNL